MRIRYNDSDCQDISQIDVTPCYNAEDGSDWSVMVTYEDPWFFKRLLAGEDTGEWAYIGEMSHEKFDNWKDAYKAAIKMVDKIFETGYLDLRNALEDYGLELI